MASFNHQRRVFVISAVATGAGCATSAARQVTEGMVWPLSDSASRITGQVIPVDAGCSSVRPLVK